MKYVYLSILLSMAPIYPSEKILPEALFIMHHAMAAVIDDFDPLFTNYRVVKKPQVNLAEVSCNEKIYLLCLQTGYIHTHYTPANHSKW
ncbi:hypothetical protein BH09DEP1_BH09DEP1_2250 [soil metagenome]